MNNLVTSSIMKTRARTLAKLGQVANQAAENAVFKIYQDRRPFNTLRSQRAALAVFAQFLQTCGMAGADLYSDPFSWRGITWGLVQTFQAWLLQNGYSIKTINDRISVVKVYMTLANQAGIVPDGEILRLQGLRGYSKKEAIDADAKRVKQGLAIRCGTKKPSPTQITEEQAQTLCQVRNETPQARRDALLMCLLLDHGMRVSELAYLQVQDIDRSSKQMTFYRPKTGKTSRHNLRGRCWELMSEYLLKDNLAKNGPLVLASCKTGDLIQGKGMTTRAITARVAILGSGIGISKLSPHDGRHRGATEAGKDPNVSLSGLMSWGDWSSAAVAIKYINRGEADNDGVNLGVD